MSPSNSQSTPSIADRSRRCVAVMGATGSIGLATIDVLKNLGNIDDRCQWDLFAVSGHKNIDALAEIASDSMLAPKRVLLSAPEMAGEFASRCPSVETATGADALIDVASSDEIDTLVASIVGRAGLESTLAAVETGKRVALANKETLVVAGPLVNAAAGANGSEILPVDSEHSAIFQCIGESAAPPKKLILTASGGPFREWTTAQMDEATPESALNHPTWQMGRKITIDSATMMNKALEIIEARWLFGLSAEAIEVVVHPQSIIHSMVEFEDGSVISQMSPPDMRMPIQYALTYPRRLPCPAETLDRGKSWDLTLQPADLERFPALQLGFEVAAAGGTAGAVVNAANEEAVGLFLDGQIRFTDIVPACRNALESHTFDANPPLSRLLELDSWARAEVRNGCGIRR